MISSPIVPFTTRDLIGGMDFNTDYTNETGKIAMYIASPELICSAGEQVYAEALVGGVSQAICGIWSTPSARNDFFSMTFVVSPNQTFRINLNTTGSASGILGSIARVI